MEGSKMPDAISMREPKQKLARLEESMPDADQIVHEFGHFLAQYLAADELVPEGFLLGCNLALHDLSRGINGWTGEPIRNSLVGFQGLTYTYLWLDVPNIAQVIFPPEFAAAVRVFLGQVARNVRPSPNTLPPEER